MAEHLLWPWCDPSQVKFTADCPQNAPLNVIQVGDNLRGSGLGTLTSGVDVDWGCRLPYTGCPASNICYAGKTDKRRQSRSPCLKAAMQTWRQINGPDDWTGQCSQGASQWSCLWQSERWLLMHLSCRNWHKPPTPLQDCTSPYVS